MKSTEPFFPGTSEWRIEHQTGERTYRGEGQKMGNISEKHQQRQQRVYLYYFID